MKHGISPTTDLKAFRRRGYMLKPMRGSAKGRPDPARITAHRAWRGPMLRAVGPGTYQQASPQDLIRKRRRSAPGKAGES